MKYRTIIFDKETGEIYYDGKTSRHVIPHNLTNFFSYQIEIYKNILRQHRFARLNIIPLGETVVEPNLFNNLNNKEQ